MAGNTEPTELDRELIERLERLPQDIDTPPYQRAIRRFTRSQWALGIYSGEDSVRQALLHDRLLATVFIHDFILPEEKSFENSAPDSEKSL